MSIKGKTIQEHIWNDLEELGEYSVWDWVNVFYYFGLDLQDKNYKKWVENLKKEGKLYSRQNFKMKYLYEVIKSKSPEMPVGKKFWTNQRFTKVIGKSVELSDVKCRDYFIKLIEIKNEN